MSAQTDDTAAKDVALEVTSHNGGAADAAGDGSPHEAVLAPRDGHAGDDSPHEAEPAPMAHEDDYDLGTAWGAPDTRTWQRKMVDNLPSLPFLSWLPKYQKSFLKGDVTSAIVVTIMLVPQAMAYSTLGGLPAFYGLYSSTLPLLLYPLFGTSHELAVGPVAMVSILNAEAIAPMTGHVFGTDEGVDGAERFIALSHLLAFMTGLIQIFLSLIHAGYVVNFLSHPVLDGFVSAASLIIGTSQLSKLLGYSIPRSPFLYETIYYAFRDIGQIDWLTVLLALENVVLLVGIQKFRRSKLEFKGSTFLKAIPGTLVVVAVNIVLIAATRLDKEGVAIVGDVPSGLPDPVAIFDKVSGSDFVALIPSAIIISMVGYMESVSVAKATSQPKGYDVDATQELMALGVANTAGSFFQTMPVTGGLSRTIVNAQSAETMLAGVGTGVLISIALVSITSVFYYLPSVTLGAIIVVACSKLFKFESAKFLWRVKRSDFYVYIFAFLATVLTGIENGILLGAGFSLLVVVRRAASPHWARVGRLPGTRTYRNCLRHSGTLMTDGIEALRIDSSLFFANAEFTATILRKACKWTRNVRFVVLDAAAVATVDASAAHKLHSVIEELEEGGVTLLFATLRGPVRDTFAATGIAQEGDEHVFESVHAAVCYARERLGLKREPKDLRELEACGDEDEAEEGEEGEKGEAEEKAAAGQDGGSAGKGADSGQGGDSEGRA